MTIIWTMSDVYHILFFNCCIIFLCPNLWALMPLLCELYCGVNLFTLDYGTIFLYIMYGCNRCVKSNIRRGYIIRYSRFWVPISDRYRHDSDRIVPFPISRITDFIFPTELSRFRFRFRIKMWKQKWLGYFPDRSRPFSSLLPRTQGVEVDDLTDPHACNPSSLNL